MNRPFRDRNPRTAEPTPPPSVAPGVFRLVPLGGFEEIGKSMTVFEYENDIVIFDMGLQWPDESMHGVDYIIPDVSYLDDKKDKIRGVVISHGHYDHIGGIPHIMPRIGKQIPIYGLPMTTSMILKRQEEFADKLNVHTVRDDEVLQLGQIRVEFVRVNHNIPDAMGVAITTPRGTIFHTGDYKIDHSPVNERPIDLAKISRIGDRGVLALLADATSAAAEGYQISETQIMKNLEPLFMQAEGRIITGTFSSLLTRLQQIIWLSARAGRKVIIEGRSMRENIAIAQNLKYVQVPSGTIIDAKEMHRYEPRQITIITTGAQGERFAALGRIARGEHQSIQIEPGDTVIFSSSFIPGNERAIEKLMTAIYRRKANVVNYKNLDIHAGGHAKSEETKVMLQLLRPKVFIPQHGSHAQCVLATQVARQVGYVPVQSTFVLDDGEVFEFLPDGSWKHRDERAPHAMVAVDGLGVGDVGEVVLKDRERMADDGIFLVVLRMTRDGKLVGNPDLISRGFVFMRGAEQLLADTRTFIKKVCATHQKLAKDDQKEFKFVLQREIEKFLFQKTEREPMVIPIVVGG